MHPDAAFEKYECALKATLQSGLGKGCSAQEGRKAGMWVRLQPLPRLAIIGKGCKPQLLQAAVQGKSGLHPARAKRLNAGRAAYGNTPHLQFLFSLADLSPSDGFCPAFMRGQPPPNNARVHVRRRIDSYHGALLSLQQLRKILDLKLGETNDPKLAIQS